MRYISLFSGVEAATLAWGPLGWEAVAFAEIEPFPSAVLAHRWPEVPNLGDVTKVDWSKYRGTVDLVVGGSPCQAFSVAGKREGLLDERGQLMLEYVRAVREIEPRWFLWENVPGVLSQDRGRAFGTLLREMDELGYGLAWRVLDAQFFGVAQRRRRVFLVGCLGSGGGASAVLFEPESVPGNTQTSKEKRKALAADAGRGPAGAGGCLSAAAYSLQTVHTRANGSGVNDTGVSYTVSTSTDQAIAFAQNQRDEVRLIGGDGQVAGSLSAARYSTHKQETLVADPVGCLTPWDVQSKRVFAEDGCGPTLQAETHEAQNIQPVVMASAHYNAEIGEGGVTPTLIAHIAKDAPVLATGPTCSQPSARQTGTSSSSTTRASAAGGSSSNQAIAMADDNAKTAVDVEMCGSLKVGGAPPMVAFPLTETT